MLNALNSPSQSTIGLWKAGLPVRSVILKPHADELVAKLVTICESSLPIVFAFCFLLFCCSTVTQVLDVLRGSLPNLNLPSRRKLSCWGKDRKEATTSDLRPVC